MLNAPVTENKASANVTKSAPGRATEKPLPARELHPRAPHLPLPQSNQARLRNGRPAMTPRPSQSPLTVQTKLMVHAPGDAYEQEADRISEQVMRMPEPRVQRACACGGTCSDCRQKSPSAEESSSVQTKRIGAGGSAQTVAPPGVHAALRSPAHPLDSTTRGFMESRFGQDFSAVRVHTGSEAAHAADALNARAFTVGQSIVFDRGNSRRLLVRQHAYRARNDPCPPAIAYGRRAGAAGNASQPPRPL